MIVRDLPPLRHTIEIETPGGRFYRWAADEPDPANRPTGIRHSSTMPGGFEQMDCTLPRLPGRDYPDLERLSTIRVLDAAGSIVWEGRLERTPRTSGDQMAVSPSAVGWQAALEDDKSLIAIYVDRDLSAWQPVSRARRIQLLAVPYVLFDPEANPDATSGLPSLSLSLRGAWATAASAEAYYDAGARGAIGAIYYDYATAPGVTAVNTNWEIRAGVATNDTLGGGTENTADLHTSGLTGSGYFTPTTARRYAWLRFRHTVAAGTDGTNYELHWRNLAVYGDHGLTRQGTAPGGFYASQIVPHAIAAGAPPLNVTDESIAATTFVIPHFSFRDRTTTGEIVRQATRFELLDWAVWEHKTFWMHERGARGRNYRARVASAQLEETGPQVDRLWNGIVVAYRDVDGSTRTVGPPGSGADTIRNELLDADPENPANQLGIRRWDLLQMGIATSAAALEIGARFLEQSRLLNTSGRARLVGHVEDDRGVLRPYSHVRAGDTITFVDASDPSPRRVVRVEHDHDARACSVDLDAPPEALGALLERLSVALVPLGVQ